MAEVVIRTEELTKRWGEVLALDSVSLEIAAGEVYGFIGPNGAGKTTTIRLLLDLLRPTSGRAEVFGLDPRRDGVKIRREVGYLPGELALHDRLTARQQLAYLENLRGGCDEAWRDELVRRFDLPLDRSIHELSKGNKQKVGIVQAFMHRPKLLILDEPTSGLDPFLRGRFVDLVGEVRAEGAAMMISSHVLSELERVADRVGLVKNGRLLVTGTIDELRRGQRQRLRIRFDGQPDTAALQAVPGVISVEDHGDGLVEVIAEGEVDALLKAIAAHRVVSLDAPEPDLEDLVISYYSHTEPGEETDEA